jgi:hypothetical protein
MAKPQEADNLRICFDRIVPELDSQKQPSTIDFRAAMMAIKQWPEDRRMLHCCFLDGDAEQRKRVEAKAHLWEMHANVKFKFVASASADAEIRISFKSNAGSWSALGTDALVESYFPKQKPTMNYGWLTADTDDRECERVVLHEFGHVLGLIHEHQSPKAKLNWNEKVVYSVFSGPPNYWTREQIDRNVLNRYSSARATRFDSNSIMLYMFSASLFRNGKGTKKNFSLSRADKEFVLQHYPF